MSCWLPKRLRSLISVQQPTLALSSIVEDPFLIASRRLMKKWVVIIAQKKCRIHLRTAIFLIFAQSVRDPFIELFRLHYLTEADGNCHEQYIHFFDKPLNSCAWIGVDYSSQLVVVNIGKPTTMIVIFNAVVSAAEVFEPPVCRTFNIDLLSTCVNDIANSLRFFQGCLGLEQEDRAYSPFLLDT